MSSNRKEFFIGSLISLTGIVLIGFGAALSEKMSMGLDPYTALNRGASSLLGFDLGSYQLGINILILIVIFLMQRSLIGWGTIYNMVLVGYLIDFFEWFFDLFIDAEAMSLVLRLLITVIAIIFFTLGVATYTETDLGVAPYDAIAPLIVDRTGWNYTPVRVAQDILVVIGAYLLSGPVGVSTVITGFFCGPLISFFSKKVSKPIVDKFMG